MVLECKYCQSNVLELVYQHYPQEDGEWGRSVEVYECQECGSRGRYEFGDGREDQYSGCLDSRVEAMTV